MITGLPDITRPTRTTVPSLTGMVLALVSFCTIKARVVHIWCPHRLHRARCCDSQAHRTAARGDPMGRNRMDLTEIAVEGYEKVIRCHDAHSGLNAIISIHNTAHGPALGGMRMWPYATLHDALLDANRLAQGMTYKSAVAETGVGGGKAGVLRPGPRGQNGGLP